MKKNFIWQAFVFNPLVVILYWMGCYYLYRLAQYGGVSRRAPIILGSFLILFIWFAWCFYRYRKGNLPFVKLASTGMETLSKWWSRIATAGMILITLVTGYNVYQSAVNLQGRLGFFIHDLINTRHVEFVQDNLYEDGLNGLLDDINQVITLPDDLYVSSTFEADFTADGQITSLYSRFYGEGEDGETESFLIDYDSSGNNEIRVHLNGYGVDLFDESEELQPMIDLAEVIPFEELVSDSDQGEYEIYYGGVRNFGANTDGIMFINEEGQVDSLEAAYNRNEMDEIEIVGYSVSVSSPDGEVLRFMEFTPHLAESTPLVGEPPFFDEVEQANEEYYYVNENLGFYLEVVDAATGSRFYALNRTLDGGETWEQINPDPFLGSLGVAAGMTFIDEQLGFAALSRGGGAHAQLYRTTDGGYTFERIELPEIEVPLTDSEMYQPFDYPDMPYMENGILYLQVCQGVDGDHNGGSQALYQSTDDGATWEFVEEQF